MFYVGAGNLRELLVAVVHITRSQREEDGVERQDNQHQNHAQEDQALRRGALRSDIQLGRGGEAGEQENGKKRKRNEKQARSNNSNSNKTEIRRDLL